jgi:hypothetical protein
MMTNKVGYPVETHWYTHPIMAFNKPNIQQPEYNLQKQATVPIQKFSKNLVQFTDSKGLSADEVQRMPNKRMTIGTVSKQWGDRTDYGWSVCFRSGNTRIHFGHGAGSIMKTSSYSERIFGELYATRAALTFLRCQLNNIWTRQ